ncbi:N-ethylmaleimide reductase [Kluyvera cryocrescens]|uniref:N-ethylmaleimide reductase n=1 Tax=Kluyvera cryocrescens TaxID=580 RepID=A0A485AQ25_KLUCR|nr:N-ethylmaleimide reductase [Kluyvera cryocrescens]
MGIRLAPLTTLMGSRDDTPEATYLAAASVLSEMGIAYIHIAEADWEDAPVMPAAFKEALRIIFHGTLIYSGKYTKARAEEALAKGWGGFDWFWSSVYRQPGSAVSPGTRSAAECAGERAVLWRRESGVCRLPGSALRADPSPLRGGATPLPLRQIIVGIQRSRRQSIGYSRFAE